MPGNVKASYYAAMVLLAIITGDAALSKAFANAIVEKKDTDDFKSFLDSCESIRELQLQPGKIKKCLQPDAAALLMPLQLFYFKINMELISRFSFRHSFLDGNRSSMPV